MRGVFILLDRYKAMFEDCTLSLRALIFHFGNKTYHSRRYFSKVSWV
jgi:hypothetical protein